MPISASTIAVAPHSLVRPRLWSVQLLRGLAAGMIVIGHSQSAIQHFAREHGRSFERWTPLPWGASVDLFFVISGFIMVFASRSLFGASGGWRLFLDRRIVRVVPLYWLCTLLYLGVLGLAAAKGGAALPTIGAIGASFAFLPFGEGPAAFPIFDLGWTLNYEMAFYLLFACAIGFGRSAALWTVGGLIAAIVVLGRFVPAEATAAYFWSRPIMLDFALGLGVGAMALGGVVLRPALRIALVAGGAWAFCADPAGLFSVALGATVDNGFPRVLTAGVPASLVMAGLLLGPMPAQPGWLSPAVLLGDASYSLYLLHPFALITAEKALQKSPLVAAAPLPLVAAATILLAVAMALASFRWLEPWLMRGGQRCLGMIAPAAIAPATPQRRSA